MKKEWKVKSTILLTQVSTGIGWICIGVSNLFEGSLIADVITMIALLAVIVCAILPYLGHREEPDEMARRHLEKAQASGYTVLSVCLLAAYLVSHVWKSLSGPFQVLAPLFLGVGCVAVSLYFLRLETRGETWQDW